jgi:hypothetical protein
MLFQVTFSLEVGTVRWKRDESESCLLNYAYNIAIFLVLYICVSGNMW